MRKAALALASIAGLALSALAPAQAPAGRRLADVLPAEGLIRSSVVRIADQAALEAHYYLADESVLELGGDTEAVFARFLAGGGEALVLAAAYPDEAAAGRVYGRFGRDFFAAGFDPQSPRHVAELESGDHAGSLRARTILIFVLEAPDRRSCDALLRRLEERALALLEKETP